MNAVRCVGQKRGFRVGEVLFRYDLWIPVEEITEEMEVPMLEIVRDVTGPEDPRLFPFALLTDEDCPQVTMDQIGERLQELEHNKAALSGQVGQLEADKEALSAQVAQIEADKEALVEQIHALQGQVSTMLTADAQQKKQIADLLKRVAELETAPKPVAAAVETPPANPAAPSTPAA